jgi:hypothetical protein
MGLLWLGPQVMETMVDYLVANVDHVYICKTGIFSGTDVPWANVLANDLADVAITTEVTKVDNGDSFSLAIEELSFTGSGAGDVDYFVLADLAGTTPLAVLPCSSLVSISASLPFNTAPQDIEVILPLKFDWLHADVLDEALDYLISNVTVARGRTSLPDPANDNTYEYYYSNLSAPVDFSTATKGDSTAGGRKITMDDWQADDAWDSAGGTTGYNVTGSPSHVQLVESADTTIPILYAQADIIALIELDDTYNYGTVWSSSRYREDKYLYFWKIDLAIGDIT